jgi:tetratricopeptide (TPR) repeat protein
VAASPHEGTLSPAEWARAMRELGLLPPLRTLFGLGFLGQASSTAYTVSGAFVGWVRETHGPRVLRAWYGGASLEALTGASWPALEEAWHRHLDTLPLAEAALAQARARFGRKGMFARRCPHEVDACRERGASLAERGDLTGALAEYERARALDADPQLGLRVAEAHVRAGHASRGAALLEALADDASLRLDLRDRAREALGDLALAEGRVDLARERYRDVSLRTIEEDALRTLDVKLVACESPLAREAIGELLVGAPGRGTDRLRAAELLGVWSERAPRDGLPHYLRARSHVSAGQWELAHARLVKAASLELPSERVRRETARLGLVAACALGDRAEARRFFEAFARERPSKARAEAARELLERCEASPPPGATEHRAP